MADIIEQYKKENAWGLLSSIDIYDCDPGKIKSKEAIVEYVSRLCQLIDMKQYGEPIVVHFGKGQTEGFSFVQFIETSLISGHFANESNRAFIDIFSCKPYDPEKAAEFSKDFFGGSSYRLNVLIRK
jgi:S-adenosylmethionine/arginine decarboxylase-like enzyme